MSLYEKIISKEEKIAVVGLGYVGMPIAVSFSKKVDVIGYDYNSAKIKLYRNGIDPTNEVGEEIVKCNVYFTDNEKDLEQALFYIVAVPTPINQDKTPDLNPVVSASKVIGRHIRQGAIVVYESTVYPGVTEDVCVPILESESGLRCGEDFYVGYSPERINPGDKKHRLENITKIISAIDETSLKEIQNVYNIVIEAGTYPVSSIRTAEAIKVVENSQRDVNIAFMNELAMVFDRMGIDTNEVVDGMNTKWNALGFRPGLVGGHCIGVDPYYFTYEAERLGYHSQIILAGRKINDSVGEFIADAAIKKMILANKTPKKAKVLICGLTFKENCPDIRNTKVIDIVKRLREYGIEPLVTDPWADKKSAFDEYNITLCDIDKISNVDCIIIAVAHNQYLEMPLKDFVNLYGTGSDEDKVLIDVKGVFEKELLDKSGLTYWKL